MKITLDRDSYSGVDGSSLSDTRCEQIVQIYKMLESLGERSISYLDIQEEADKHKIFGDIQTKSAVRTFFPLLKKLHFVNYEGSFPANKCFTDLGKKFVLVCSSILQLSDDTPNSEKIKNRLQSMKEDIQKQGLLEMLNDPEWKSHNIRIALSLLKNFKIINWNEFLYSLHKLSMGLSLDDAIDDIRKNRDTIDSYEFVNEKGNNLPSTCYIYIRNLLCESGIIINLKSNVSKLTDDGIKFLNYLNI